MNAPSNSALWRLLTNELSRGGLFISCPSSDLPEALRDQDNTFTNLDQDQLTKFLIGQYVQLPSSIKQPRKRRFGNLVK